MNVTLDNARRAYEAAKRISAYEAENGIFQLDACVIKAIATTTYEAALLADAQAKLDAMGVVIGETVVCAPDRPDISPFIVSRLVAVPDDDLVFAFGDDGKCVPAIHLRPYVAPVVKEMVLFGKAGRDVEWIFGEEMHLSDTHRLTLSGITPADLDGMTGPITGTYTVEKLW